MIQFNAEQPVAVNLAATQEIISQIRADAIGGWFDLPERYERGEMQTELTSIKSAAAKIQSDSKFLVCIGIGGSYLSTALSSKLSKASRKLKQRPRFFMLATP